MSGREVFKCVHTEPSVTQGLLKIKTKARHIAKSFVLRTK